MAKSIALADLVKAAEEATKSIQDQDLRRIAFDRVLQHLLSSSELSPEPNTAALGGPKKAAKLPAEAGKDSAKDGPKSRISELIDEGFFSKPRNSSDIREELDKRGVILKPSDLTSPLARLVSERRLRRSRQTAKEGGRSQMHWHNW